MRGCDHRSKTSVIADDVLFEVGEADPAATAKAPAGAGKTFRRYDQVQSFLLSPSLDDWLLEDHTARFVSEAVDHLLDFSDIYEVKGSAD